jgi:hypothetical protein
MPSRPRYYLALSLCALCLAACNDEPDTSNERAVVFKKPEDLPKWLGISDKIEPSLWLRSREVGHEVLPSDPEVDRLRRAMQQASVRFYEDGRMIANRTAQTGDALAEIGQPERYVDILTSMIDVADFSPDRQLFGEMCQHYLITRKNGEDRTEALQQLSAAYKHAARCTAPPCGDVPQ